MKKIIFTFLAFFAANAFADSPQAAYIAGSQDYPAQVRKTSRAAACTQYIGFYNAANSKNWTISVKSTDNSMCRVFNGTAAQFDVGISEFSNGICADGSSPNTTLPLAQQCAAPAPVCTPGREFSAEVPMGTVSAPDMDYPININGCRVSVTAFEGCQSNPATGALQCKFRLKEHEAAPTGEAQTPLASPIPTPKPEEVPPHNPAQGQGCPAGTKSLGIDSTGGTICGGSGTSPTTPAKTETKTNTPPVTNADGSTTKTDVTTRVNSDGSTTTTTKTTTTGTDGKVTTNESAVTGSKPNAGGAGKDDTSDEKKDDFCLKNPSLNICKNSEVTQGSCSNGTDSTSCTGDAIQCAILREQKRQFCELNKENPSATLGNQAIAGNDPIKSTLPTKENASAINMQALSQASFLGGGSCFADKSFSLQGLTVSLPFSKVCPYLEWLRYVVMLIAALVSLKIVSKPVLGD